MSIIENKFHPGQKAWWLNTTSWQVQRVAIIKYHAIRQWVVEPAGCRVMFVRESELFSNQADACKEGIAQLMKMAESFSIELNEVQIAYRKLVHEAKIIS